MPTSTEDKERFEKIRKISQEILAAHFDYGCDRAKILELAMLASCYDYMQLDQEMMRLYFDRYESLKKNAKRQEAWSRVIDHVDRLNGFASMRRDDGD
jgi:hypothetical protein